MLILSPTALSTLENVFYKRGHPSSIAGTPQAQKAAADLIHLVVVKLNFDTMGYWFRSIHRSEIAFKLKDKLQSLQLIRVVRNFHLFFGNRVINILARIQGLFKYFNQFVIGYFKPFVKVL